MIKQSSGYAENNQQKSYQKRLSSILRLNSILESALAKVDAQRQVSMISIGYSTALVNRSLDVNSINNVFALLAEEKGFLTNGILVIRRVCKLWQYIIDGVLFNCNGILQQKFLVQLTTIKQLAAITYIKLSLNDHNCIGLTEDEYIKSKFIVNKNLCVKINISKNNNYTALIELINQKESSLNNINTISFGEVNVNTIKVVMGWLKIIFLNQKDLFSGLRQITFGKIESKVELIIPAFECLNTLIIGHVFGSFKISAYLPNLKKLEYGCNKEGDYLKDIVNEGCITFYPHDNCLNEFLDFINNPDNVCWLKDIKTITICSFLDIEDVQKFIDCVHSKQDLLTNLKKIYFFNEAYQLNLLKILQIPKFLEQIEVVCYDRIGVKKL